MSAEIQARQVSGAKTPVLMYHSLDDTGSVLSTRPEVFAQQMEVLQARRMRTITVGELASCLRRGALPHDAVALTFDDGFRSFHEVAFQILRDHAFTATVFLVPGFVGKTNDWPGQSAHIPRRPLLDWPEIEEMAAAGIELGAHTLHHPDLARISSADAVEEVVGSKKRIEDRLGRRVESFAYPYGSMNGRVRDIAADAFAVACGTRLDYVRPDADVYALARLDTYYLRNLKLFRRLFETKTELYLSARRWLRESRSRWRQSH